MIRNRHRCFEVSFLEHLYDWKDESPVLVKQRMVSEADMSQVKKGNQWYFGMKAHIGVDTKY